MPMTSPVVFASLYLVVELLLFAQPRESCTLVSKGGAGLIDRTCKVTPYYDLCRTTLALYPNGSSLTDVCSLADVIVGSAQTEARDTLSLAEALINQTADPRMERPLDYCAELYIPVVKYIIPQAIHALDEGKYGFASYCLSDAGDQADACQKVILGSPGSPLADQNKMVRKLCDVAVAIIKLLQKG